MCTVQVLIGADVMRRENLRRNMMRPGNRSTCRRLFQCEPPSGPAAPDPQAAVQRLQAELGERAARRWNFDFLRERPLPGRYQWVPVGAAGPSRPKEDAVVAELRTAQPEPEPKEDAVVAEVRTAETAQPKQSKITDYMNHRKRRSSTSASSPKLKTRRGNTGNSSCNTTTSTDSSSVSSA